MNTQKEILQALADVTHLVMDVVVAKDHSDIMYKSGEDILDKLRSVADHMESEQDSELSVIRDILSLNLNMTHPIRREADNALVIDGLLRRITSLQELDTNGSESCTNSLNIILQQEFADIAVSEISEIGIGNIVRRLRKNKYLNIEIVSAMHGVGINLNHNMLRFFSDKNIEGSPSKYKSAPSCTQAFLDLIEEHYHGLEVWDYRRDVVVDISRKLLLNGYSAVDILETLRDSFNIGSDDITTIVYEEKSNIVRADFEDKPDIAIDAAKVIEKLYDGKPMLLAHVVSEVSAELLAMGHDIIPVMETLRTIHDKEHKKIADDIFTDLLAEMKGEQE